MHQLRILNIETHSYHGCLPEETKIGSRFSVDVEFEGDFSQAVSSDDLRHAIDYVIVHRIVREEMAKPSKLIEHVAGRILKRMQEQFPEVAKRRVIIRKFNPPVNGQLGTAEFSISG